MNINDLKEILYKISVKFLRDNNTMIGSFTYQDLISDLFYSARKRQIINNLQLFEVNLVNIESKDFIEAVFQFSPEYLNREDEMFYAGMNETKWKLVLPNSIDRVGNIVLENDSAGISKEIIENIASSYVEIIFYEVQSDIPKQNFINSLIKEVT